MSKDIIMNFFLFLGICFLFFIIFRTTIIKEYMTNRKDNSDKSSSTKDTKDATKPTSPSSSLNTGGIAGNSSAYAANIRAEVIKLQDILLISKYRSDYENSVMAVDDLVNSLMLEKVLSINMSSPEKDLDALVGLNNVKAALNNVMSHVDSSN